MRAGRGSGWQAAGHAGTVLAAATLVGLWVTRPLVAHLRDHSLVAYPYTAFDVPLNAWILSWVSHALATAPGALFGANIYHPEPHALAYTEHMLGIAPFFAPTFLTTGNPALALNVMILAGLVLTAAGTYWVTWRWTGSRAAAVTAGLVVGFHGAQVRALGPNLQTTQYLPFVLLFLDRVLAGGGAVPTAALALALTGQSLTSYYYAYPTMLGTGLAVVLVCAVPALRPRVGALARTGLALAVAVVALAAVSVPYFGVAASGTDTVFNAARVFETAPWRATALAALAPGRLGVGIVALATAGALAALGGRMSRAGRRRVLLLLAWVVVGHVLAAGPGIRVADTVVPMPGTLLDRWAPGFVALRDRRRLFVIVPVALGVLAGIGIAAVARARRRPRLAAALLALLGLVGAVAVTDLGPTRLMALPTGSGVPAIYRELAARPTGPVLELPVGVTLRDVSTAFANTWYEYFSIFHWRPLVNGYASYWPPRLEVTVAMARALPQPRALANLASCTGLRWIVTHAQRMSPAERAAFAGDVRGLRLVARLGDDALWEVDPPPPADAPCRARLLAPAGGTSLEGTPLAPLSVTERRAVLDSVTLPAAVPAGRPAAALAVPVRLRNAGGQAWPAVAVDEEHLVRLSYVWHHADGTPVPTPWRLWTRLPVDLRPGETIDVPLAVRAPNASGSYRLEVVVRQGLQGLFQLSGPGAAPVAVAVR